MMRKREHEEEKGKWQQRFFTLLPFFLVTIPTRKVTRETKSETSLTIVSLGLFSSHLLDRDRNQERRDGIIKTIFQEKESILYNPKLFRSFPSLILPQISQVKSVFISEKIKSNTFTSVRNKAIKNLQGTLFKGSHSPSQRCFS